MYEILNKYDVELSNILTIDEFNIKDIQLKLPGIKHIWAGRLIRHKKELLDVKENKKALLLSTIKSIQANEIVRVNALVAEKMANNSEQIKKINKTIEDLQLIIEFLEKVEKIMSSLSYDISNIIKIMQLEQT
jgi:hypothetical protein